jgi:hypothetical protein
VFQLSFAVISKSTTQALVTARATLALRKGREDEGAMLRTVNTPPRSETKFERAAEQLRRSFPDRREDPAERAAAITSERFGFAQGAAPL